MSRSNNTELVNPTTRFIEWKGDDGKFQYYDKEAKLNVEIPLPFCFIVLDQLTTIKGYSDADQSGFWSNEVRDLTAETLIVRTKNEKFSPMLYEQVKEKLSSKGAQYSKSVYVGFYDENKKLVLGNINIKGCAIAPWIDFCKSTNVMEVGVKVKTMIEGKKGKTVFQSPVFEPLKISEESNLAAIELDKELQEYLTAYFKNAKKEVTESKSEIIESQVTKEQVNTAIHNTQTREIAKTQVQNFTNTDDDLPF